MLLIVVFFTIVFFVAGYYLMDRIDQFIGNRVTLSDEHLLYEYKNKKIIKQGGILIYGNNELTNLVKSYCDSKMYQYESITELDYIDTENRYMYLFALSYNDVDNLMISSIGLKIYSILNIVTICNDQGNLKIYNEFNLSNVVMYSDTNKVYNIIKESVENAVKNKA